MRTLFAVLAIMLIASVSAHSAENLLKSNADFSRGLDGWELYGQDKQKIHLGAGQGPKGSNCAIVPVAHASISQGMALKPDTVYELSFKFRRTSPATRGHIDFFLNKLNGINASAGHLNAEFPRESTADKGWEVFREAFRTPSVTAGGKLILESEGMGEVSYAQVSLVEIGSPRNSSDLLPTSDLSYLPNIRTKNPLFDELLSNSPGNYTVVAWAHNLNKNNLPSEMVHKYTDEQWAQEQMKSFADAKEAGMYYYWLPGHADEADGLYRRFHTKFDVACQTSAVMGEAIRNGGEVVNPVAASTTSAPGRVMLVDPAYVDAAKRTIQRLSEKFKGRPYVFAYVGKDEPSIAIPEGPMSSWGPFGKKCAQEVLTKYGFGKYAMPAPGDPAYLKDTLNQPYRWIAFNRWMARKYADSQKTLYDTLKLVDPKARYEPCDYWFMSGFIPYDFARMAKHSDIVECDPYASSGERAGKGRGLYNHGFGPKFLRDITGKPVRSVVQAFDYAGYEMTPGDLLEWVSQSMRTGASHISYYQMDNPKYTDPDRWKMMMYASKVVTGMKAIKLPDDPETAILYSSDSYRSQGSSTNANEIYTAYALLGERAGSWFDFVGDESLARGEKKLAKYRALYIPLATYESPSAIARIERFVRNGGMVICGDPMVFSHGPDGADLSARRESMFGVKVMGPKTRGSMVIGRSAWSGSAAGLTLPVYRPVHGGWYVENGCEIKTLRPDVKIIAKFADGSPAITVTKVGKGQAVYFAANPFVPECLCEGDGWEKLIRGFQKHLGAKTDRPIWRFKIPPPPKE